MSATRPPQPPGACASNNLNFVHFVQISLVGKKLSAKKLQIMVDSYLGPKGMSNQEVNNRWSGNFSNERLVQNQKQSVFWEKNTFLTIKSEKTTFRWSNVVFETIFPTYWEYIWSSKVVLDFYHLWEWGKGCFRQWRWPFTHFQKLHQIYPKWLGKCLKNLVWPQKSGFLALYKKQNLRGFF